MSSIVSRSPSSRNHWNEAFWISMRFGRSRTCSSRLNDLRARGETTVVVKKNSLPWDVRKISASERRQNDEQDAPQAYRWRNQPGYRNDPSQRKPKLRREPVLRSRVY